LEEKNTSTNNYKDSLDKEELKKFNSGMDNLIFLNAIYNLFTKHNQPITRGIIIYYPFPEKEEKDDKMDD